MSITHEGKAMNYMEAVLEPGERVYKRCIIHDTFGHLRAPADIVYTGWILFTHACCGDITVINYEFRDDKGTELNSSPWLWEHINEFVGDKVLPPRAIKCRLASGNVFMFRGTYIVKPDRPKSPGSSVMIEGKSKFRGRVKRVRFDA